MCIHQDYFLLPRLEHNKDTTRRTSQTYVLPRILQFMTAFIWVAFACFFKRRIKRTISNICPQGKLSAIGGMKKRNLLTVEDDLTMLATLVLGIAVDNAIIFSAQAYQDQMGRSFVTHLYVLILF